MLSGALTIYKRILTLEVDWRPLYQELLQISVHRYPQLQGMYYRHMQQGAVISMAAKLRRYFSAADAADIFQVTFDWRDGTELQQKQVGCTAKYLSWHHRWFTAAPQVCLVYTRNQRSLWHLVVVLPVARSEQMQLKLINSLFSWQGWLAWRPCSPSLLCWRQSEEVGGVQHCLLRIQRC